MYTITNTVLAYPYIFIYAHTVPDNVHHLHVQKALTYKKPEAASAVLGSW